MNNTLDKFINKNSTVGQIAAEWPQTKSVFAKHNIDFCCGGNKLLINAIEEQKLDYNSIINELDQKLCSVNNDETPQKQWVNENLIELVDYIEQAHHKFTVIQLEYIQNLLNKVIIAHGITHQKTLIPLKNLFENLKDKLISHMKQEEEDLFPYIRIVDYSTNQSKKTKYYQEKILSALLKDLDYDHIDAGQKLSEIRQITSNFTLPKDACMTYSALYESLEALEKDLHDHIHLENNILFKRLLNNIL